MEESFQDIITVFKSFQGQFKDMDDKHLVELTKLVVYNQMSVDWLGVARPEVVH